MCKKKQKKKTKVFAVLKRKPTRKPTNSFNSYISPQLLVCNNNNDDDDNITTNYNAAAAQNTFISIPNWVFARRLAEEKQNKKSYTHTHCANGLL